MARPHSLRSSPGRCARVPRAAARAPQGHAARPAHAVKLDRSHSSSSVVTPAGTRTRRGWELGREPLRRQVHALRRRVAGAPADSAVLTGRLPQLPRPRPHRRFDASRVEFSGQTRRLPGAHAAPRKRAWCGVHALALRVRSRPPGRYHARVLAWRPGPRPGDREEPDRRRGGRFAPLVADDEKGCTRAGAPGARRVSRRRRARGVGGRRLPAAGAAPWVVVSHQDLNNSRS